MSQVSKISLSAGAIALSLLAAVGCTKGGSSLTSPATSFKADGLKAITTQKEDSTVREYEFKDGSQVVKISVPVQGQTNKASTTEDKNEYTVTDFCVSSTNDAKSCEELVVAVSRKNGLVEQTQTSLFKLSADNTYAETCSRPLAFESAEKAHEALTATCQKAEQKADQKPAPTTEQAQ